MILSKLSILNINFINIETFLEYRAFSPSHLPSAIIILFCKRISSCRKSPLSPPTPPAAVSASTTPCLGICPRILPFSNPTPPANPSLWAAKHGNRCRANRCPAVKISSSPAKIIRPKARKRRLLWKMRWLCVRGLKKSSSWAARKFYAQALPIATDLRLTEVGLDVDGDAFFPVVFHRNMARSLSGKPCFRQRHRIRVCALCEGIIRQCKGRLKPCFSGFRRPFYFVCLRHTV